MPGRCVPFCKEIQGQSKKTDLGQVHPNKAPAS